MEWIFSVVLEVNEGLVGLIGRSMGLNWNEFLFWVYVNIVVELWLYLVIRWSVGKCIL